ncbi:hypothetical protein BpHYR1_027185 [Brachionus plicatilis]|uniref:Uncharacterized protein n=1 Tax=Brachionus plicatilis TaxID=10195 RepID=A0A3M7QQJ6_BRAPC|nr:hypothetical protein BpHYR1_027185 [Brachionus plicatilis]
MEVKVKIKNHKFFHTQNNARFLQLLICTVIHLNDLSSTSFVSICSEFCLAYFKRKKVSGENFSEYMKLYSAILKFNNLSMSSLS